MLGDNPEPPGDEFGHFYDITHRVLWPEVWIRPRPGARARSSTVAALTARGFVQFGHGICPTLANGATKQEIAEAFTQMAIYAGRPAAGSAAKAARDLGRDTAISIAPASAGV